MENGNTDNILIKSGDNYKTVASNNVIEPTKPVLIVASRIVMINTSLIIPSSIIDAIDEYSEDLTKYYKIIPEDANIHNHVVYDTDCKYITISSDGILRVNKYINNIEFNIYIRLVSYPKIYTIKGKFEKAINDDYYHTKLLFDKDINDVVNNYGYGKSNANLIGFDNKNYAYIDDTSKARIVTYNNRPCIEIPVDDDMPDSIEINFVVWGYTKETPNDSTIFELINDNIDGEDGKLLEIKSSVITTHNPMDITTRENNRAYDIIYRTNKAIIKNNIGTYTTSGMYLVGGDRELMGIDLSTIVPSSPYIPSYYQAYRIRIYQNGELQIYIYTGNKYIKNKNLTYRSAGTVIGTNAPYRAGYNSTLAHLYDYDNHNWYNKPAGDDQLNTETDISPYNTSISYDFMLPCNPINNITRILIGNNSSLNQSSPVMIDNIAISKFTPYYEQLLYGWYILNEYEYYNNHLTFKNYGSDNRLAIECINISNDNVKFDQLGMYINEYNSLGGIKVSFPSGFINTTDDLPLFYIEIASRLITNTINQDGGIEGQAVICGFYITSDETIVTEDTITSIEYVISGKTHYIILTKNNIKYTASTTGSIVFSEDNIETYQYNKYSLIIKTESIRLRISANNTSYYLSSLSSITYDASSVFTSPDDNTISVSDWVDVFNKFDTFTVSNDINFTDKSYPSIITRIKIANDDSI